MSSSFVCCLLFLSFSFMTLKSTFLALWWEPGQDGEELFCVISLSL